MHPDGERYKETKLHTLYHIAFFAKYLSLKVTYCYMFEDFIGKIQETGKVSVHATPMHNVPRKIFEYYSRAKQIILLRRETGGP